MIPRLYQQELFYKARNKNSLVVLPTGAGKTLIGFLLAKYKMKEGKILFLSPTKPLCVQHMNSFGSGVVITGETKPDERKKFYEENKIIFATPQTIENDIISNRINLKDFSLIIFDEAHRAIGNYSYVFIAREYKKLKNGLILGLTASPGDSEEKIREICENLFIQQVLYKDESELIDYLKMKEIKKVYVELPSEMKDILKILRKCLKIRLKEIGAEDLNKRELLKMRSEFISKRDLISLSKIAEIIKIMYAIELLETEGIEPLEKFFRKIIKESNRIKANKRLLKDLLFREAMRKTFSIKDEHPKYKKLKEIIGENNGKKIIFVQYRNTAERVMNYIKDVSKPVLFIGQRNGMSQKKQVEVLNEFKSGKYDTLVCTSIGEEGLHIDRADLGIFFEPVPSGLRMIQRKGRIGRTNFGEIYILITKGTIDEKYYWISRYKEKKMKENLKNVSSQLGLKNLKDFF